LSRTVFIRHWCICFIAVHSYWFCVWMLGAGSSVRIRIGGRARSPTHSPVDVTNKWSSHSQDKVRIKYSVNQCSGSMTFWCGSGPGSADPCLWLYGSGFGCGSSCFRHWPSRGQQKTILKTFFCILPTFWRYIYIIFLKKSKRRKRRRNQGFSYYFCLMIEGSGSGTAPYPDPCLCLMDPDPDPEGPQHIRIKCTSVGWGAWWTNSESWGSGTSAEHTN
jgi:hypothetical protein